MREGMSRVRRVFALPEPAPRTRRRRWGGLVLATLLALVLAGAARPEGALASQAPAPDWLPPQARLSPEAPLWPQDSLAPPPAQLSQQEPLTPQLASLSQQEPLVSPSASLSQAAPAEAGPRGARGADEGRPRVAVVLGGGAARGFSHIGLLKALEENGVPVDILVGTSMGSIVAGLYASGLSVENLTYLVTQVDLNRFFSPRIPPGGGLVDTGRFELFINELTNYARVEDLPVPYYSVVVDLQSGAEVALSHGPLGRAIVASMAIPGMFPPVEIDGAYYVDGGLLSVVPVRAAQAAGADFIIAVDVSRRPGEEADFENVFSNLQMALDVLLARHHDDQIESADVIVTPDVADNSYMEYDRAAYFIEEGYRAAMEAMDEIKAGLLRLDPDLPLGRPRRTEGVPMERFVRMVDEAAARAAVASGRTPVLLPDVTVRPGQPPHYMVDVRVPLGGERPLLPWFLDYTLAADGRTWSHGLGIGAGHCGRLCASLFAFSGPGTHRWQPGAAVAGTLGVRSTPSARSAAWAARWESAPPGGDAEWHVQVRWPAPDALTTAGRELVVDVGRDSRGLFGAPDFRLKAAAVYRRYRVSEPRNLWELLRGGVHWYIGGGLGVALVDNGAGVAFADHAAGVAFADGTSGAPVSDGGPGASVNPGFHLYVYPVLEAGFLLEAHLFGLHTIRSRLALTYEGGPDPTWYVRLSFGD